MKTLPFLISSHAFVLISQAAIRGGGGARGGSITGNRPTAQPHQISPSQPLTASKSKPEFVTTLSKSFCRSLEKHIFDFTDFTTMFCSIVLFFNAFNFYQSFKTDDRSLYFCEFFMVYSINVHYCCLWLLNFFKGAFMHIWKSVNTFVCT